MQNYNVIFPTSETCQMGVQTKGGCSLSVDVLVCSPTKPTCSARLHHQWDPSMSNVDSTPVEPAVPTNVVHAMIVIGLWVVLSGPRHDGMHCLLMCMNLIYSSYPVI